MSRTLTFSLLGGALACACTASDPSTAGELSPASGGLTPDQSSKGGELRVQQTNLASDQQGVAPHTVQQLSNAWGLAVDPEPATGPEFWVAANGSNVLVVLAADGTPTGMTVNVATAPTGLSYTESPDLLGDEFILSTEAGTIGGWQDSAGTNAVVRVNASASGAVYKGAALFDRCEGHVSLAATDFHGGKVDVFGPGYLAIPDAGFVDPDIPSGFAPFGIAQLGGEIYVSYAKQSADGVEDVAGPGNGFVDVFHPDGTLDRRLISGGHLNSPWGMALMPEGFGALSNMLLVANFGDGAINVYEPHSGAWRGQLNDESGRPLTIDGLWAIMVGPKTDAVDLSDRLFFTAGPGDETHGLFGTLRPVTQNQE
jgi:uncharacterized protein (TIGR03118 family)